MKAMHGVSVSLLLLTLIPTSLFSQTDADRSMIWQECVNIFEFQSLIPGDGETTGLAVYADPGTEPLPDGTSLISFGRKVELVTAERISAEGIEPYFRFEKLDMQGSSSATADFSFIFRDDGGTRTREIQVHADMHKTPNGWSVREKILEERF